MSRSSHLESFLRNLINNVPIEKYDPELLNDLDRRFQAVEDHSIELEKEFGVDLDGRLFLTFYRLACFEGFEDVHLPEKLLVYSSIKKNQKIYKKGMASHREGDLESDIQKYVDSAKTVSSLEYTFGENKSLSSIKEIVSKYRDTWVDIYLDDSNDNRMINEELLDRVLSVRVPVYSELLEVDDLISFSIEMFDLSLELAVCAFTAFELKNESLSWTALSKANELLGLSLGSVIKAQKNKKYIARRKGPHVKQLENEFIKSYLIKKVHEKTAKAKNSLHSTRDSDQQLKEALLGELDVYSRTMHDKLDKLVSERYLPASGGSIKPKDVLWKRLENWIDGDPDFQHAIDEYIKAERSTPFDDQVNSGWACLKKDDLSKMLKTLNLMSLTNNTTGCTANNCPINQDYATRAKEVRSLLNDPLFSTLQSLHHAEKQAKNRYKTRSHKNERIKSRIDTRKLSKVGARMERRSNRYLN